MAYKNVYFPTASKKVQKPVVRAEEPELSDPLNNIVHQ